jgi:hypothetical protein
MRAFLVQFFDASRTKFVASVIEAEFLLLGPSIAPVPWYTRSLHWTVAFLRYPRGFPKPMRYETVRKWR